LNFGSDDGGPSGHAIMPASGCIGVGKFCDANVVRTRCPILAPHILTADLTGAGRDEARGHPEEATMTSCQPFELTDDQRELQMLVREFAEREIAPHAAEWDRDHTFPTDVIRKLGELGAMGVAFPEEYGGLGMGAVAQAVVVEELARIDSSVAVTVGANVSIAGEPVRLFGTEEQKQRWLVPLARGETLGAFASTEPGGGSDVQAALTTAVWDGDCWVINNT